MELLICAPRSQVNFLIARVKKVNTAKALKDILLRRYGILYIKILKDLLFCIIGKRKLNYGSPIISKLISFTFQITYILSCLIVIHLTQFY